MASGALVSLPPGFRKKNLVSIFSDSILFPPHPTPTHPLEVTTVLNYKFIISFLCLIVLPWVCLTWRLCFCTWSMGIHVQQLVCSGYPGVTLPVTGCIPGISLGEDMLLSKELMLPSAGGILLFLIPGPLGFVRSPLSPLYLWLPLPRMSFPIYPGTGGFSSYPPAPTWNVSSEHFSDHKPPLPQDGRAGLLAAWFIAVFPRAQHSK